MNDADRLYSDHGRPLPRRAFEPSRGVRFVRTAVHLTGEGLRGLFVAPGQVLACFLSLSVASCLVTLFAAYGGVAIRILDRSAERARILVYLKEGIASDRVQTLITEIRDRSDVTEVRYFSAGQDRARNAALLPKDLVASLPPESIPGEHGLEVQISGTSQRPPEVADLVAFIQGLEEVEVVAGPPVGADRIRAVAAAVRFARVGLTLLSLLLLVSTVFFVVGTLTRTMERRRESMAILRLVGATSTYLKTPIYIQGVIQGVTGVGAGVAAALFVLAITDSWVREELGIAVRLAFPWGSTLISSAAIGATMGWVGATLATLRRLP